MFLTPPPPPNPSQDTQLSFDGPLNGVRILLEYLYRILLIIILSILVVPGGSGGQQVRYGGRNQLTHAIESSLTL